jgi:SAM-dependent methyltransferase
LAPPIALLRRSMNALPGKPRRPRWLIVAANIHHNLSARWQLTLGRRESDIGATHRGLSTERSVAYINRVFQDYLAYSGLTSADLVGKRILELGPGDNLGVALRFYAAGAAQVTCLDKLFSRRDTAQQAEIYRALREHLSPSEQARYGSAINLDGSAKINEDCVRYVWGTAAEDARNVLAEHSFDLIVSRAVLWEIHEIDRTLQTLDALLRPGGMMIHKIACLDWMFRQNGYHPLEFLTIPEQLYRWMARDSGKSNRCTIAYYRDAMSRLRYSAHFHITRVVGAPGEEFPPGTTALVANVHYTDETLGLLGEIRPRLLPRFRRLDDQDLMVEDMFLVAVKTTGHS